MMGDARQVEHYQDAEGNVWIRCPDLARGRWCLAAEGGMLGACFGDLGATTAESVIGKIGEQLNRTIQTYGEARAGKSLQDTVVAIVALVVAGIVITKLL